MNNRESVEAMVISWLNDLVPGYPASSDTPKDLPDRFSLVTRTGGRREAMFGDLAEILVEIYDKDSRYDCSQIADFIADKVPELRSEYENITMARVNSVIALDDTKKQYYRYQVYCDVFHSRVAMQNMEPPVTGNISA